MLASLVSGLAMLPLGASAEDISDVAEARLQTIYGEHIKVAEANLIANGQILEVTMESGPFLYMTPDASHLIYRDEVIRIDGGSAVNVTEARLNPKRAKALAAVANDQTVVFEAKGDQKALINVFTDIDCGYCQKLHQEVDELNDLGITVRYLAYPRSGIVDRQTGQPTQSYQKINYVWCQDDRAAAMTEMKTDQQQLNSLGRQLRAGNSALQGKVEKLQQTLVSNMQSGNGCATPVAQQYQLGQQLGVNGTPAIFTEDGQLYPGYMPAKEMAKALGVL